MFWCSILGSGRKRNEYKAPMVLWIEKRGRIITCIAVFSVVLLCYPTLK